MKAEWEVIEQHTPDDITQRMAVPGGWLVCRLQGTHNPKSMASWFVDDPNHDQWLLD